ncbi:MAG: hypothetical protein ACREHE_04735 [Rhizomicrobium sp.]
MAIRTHAFTFDATDGTRIAAYRSSSDAPVQGVLQVAHGMDRLLRDSSMQG